MHSGWVRDELLKECYPLRVENKILNRKCIILKGRAFDIHGLVMIVTLFNKSHNLYFSSHVIHGPLYIWAR